MTVPLLMPRNDAVKVAPGDCQSCGVSPTELDGGPTHAFLVRWLEFSNDRRDLLIAARSVKGDEETPVPVFQRTEMRVVRTGLESDSVTASTEG